jgi:hypothetical protein
MSFRTVSLVGVHTLRPGRPLAFLTSYIVSAIVFLPLVGTHRWIKLGCEYAVMRGRLSDAQFLVVWGNIQRLLVARLTVSSSSYFGIIGSTLKATGKS